MEKLGYPWRQYSNRIVQVVQKTRLHLVNDKRRRRQSLLVESHHQEEEAPAPPRLKWEVDDVGRGEKVGGGCRFYFLSFLYWFHSNSYPIQYIYITPHLSRHTHIRKTTSLTRRLAYSVSVWRVYRYRAKRRTILYPKIDRPKQVCVCSWEMDVG